VTRAIVGLLTALVVAACSTSSGLGGLDFPVQREGESYPGARRELEGTAHRAGNGCVFVMLGSTRYHAIWPAGTRYGEIVTLPNGDELREGGRFRGIGALTPAAPLTRDPNGYWSYEIGFCDKGAEVLLVLDEVTMIE
jgi:hypothetical protein